MAKKHATIRGMDWLLEQWHDIKGHAKWYLITLTGGVILWILPRLTKGLSWWQKLGLVIVATSFGAVTYVVGRSVRKSVSQQDSIDVRPINSIEIYQIGFDYLPASPLANGWRVAYQDPEAKPSFTSPEISGDGGLSMDVRKKYAIRYSTPSEAQFANEMELAIKYGDGAMFHVIVSVTSRDHSQTDYGEIKIKVGNAPPEHHKDYPKEHVVYVTPEPMQNGWLKMRVPIPKIVSAAMGEAGWVYESMRAVQLRGCISVSPIKFFGKVDNH